jgi:oxygen-independent coproporphyrinogen-3 oxidase
MEKVVCEAAWKKEMFSPGYLVDSIYIGGGTPSILQPALIEELLDALYATCDVADDAEITIEVNPGAANADLFAAYRANGVNRVSIGAQSFNADMLAFLGRIHSRENALACYADARNAGFEDVNLDLIFGIPGQDLAMWERDLRTAVNLGPTHLSFYSLQIEEDTPLYADFMNGRIQEPDEIEDRRMYHLAKEYTEGLGYLHYEISNCAKPGRESRHNLKYWSMDDYIGLGLAAHSYMRGHRLSNTSSLPEYLTAAGTPEMVDWMHKSTTSEEMSEYIFLGLRRTAGIDLARFRASFGKDFWELYGEETAGLIRRGLLEHSGDVLRLTALGLDLANNVFREYI